MSFRSPFSVQIFKDLFYSPFEEEGAPPTVTFNILTEVGDSIITEAGDNIVLQSAP